MIELSKTIQTSDGVLVPAGVRLDFHSGKAKYQGHPIERKFVPLQAIKGAQGPFLHACVATVLNDNRGFQQVYNKKYQDWAHCVVSGDYLFIYVWDTRQVIEVIPGLHAAAKGGTVTRRLINPKTGEKIEQVLGHSQFGWAKSLYEMLMWPQYHRQDNGLPLVTDNQGWKDIVDNFNQTIEAKFAYEASYIFDARESDEFTPEYRQELAEQGLAMPDGSYPIRNIDDLHNAIQAYGRTGDNKEETKNWIIKRAKELNAVAELPESWNVAIEQYVRANEAVIGPRGREIQVFRYNASMQSTLKQFKAKFIDYQPWMHIAIAKAKPCYAIYIWDTRQVLESGELTKEQAMQLVQLGYQMKAFANDNAQPLKGSGDAVKVMNWSMAKTSES